MAHHHRFAQSKPSTRDPRTEVRHGRHKTVGRVFAMDISARIMLKCRGPRVGCNVACRFHHEKGLALRTKRPRWRKMIAHRRSARTPCARMRSGASTSFTINSTTAPRNGYWRGSLDRCRRSTCSGHVAAVLNRLVCHRGASAYQFRDEWPNLNWLAFPDEAQTAIKVWRWLQ